MSPLTAVSVGCAVIASVTSGAAGGVVDGGVTGVPTSSVFFGSAVTTGVTSCTGSSVMPSCGFGSTMRSVILPSPPGSSQSVVLVTSALAGSNAVLAPGSVNLGYGTFATRTVWGSSFSEQPCAMGVV